MAGTDVYISPTGLMMIHNPMTIAFGDAGEMEKAISMLSEVKESIINAYEIKTGLSRTKLSHLMDAETWFNAKKAVELGFADGILFSELRADMPNSEGVSFSNIAVINSLIEKLPKAEKAKALDITQFDKRLNLLKK